MLKLPGNYDGPLIDGERWLLLEDLANVGFEVLPPVKKRNAPKVKTLVVFLGNEKFAYINSHVVKFGILGCEMLKSRRRTGKFTKEEVYDSIGTYVSKNGGDRSGLIDIPGEGSDNGGARYVVFTERTSAFRMLRREAGLVDV